MKIFTADALRELDKATCESQNIDSLELMERAANAACYEIISRFLPGQRIVVVAGPGNNGGDALAVARLLIEAACAAPVGRPSNCPTSGIMPREYVPAAAGS